MSDFRMVIVPNELADAIYEKLDAEIAKHPDAAVDRAIFFDQLLAYYDQHGVIPEFSLAKNQESES